MGELGLLAEDFACATESAAPEIIGIIATKRLEASRLRLQSDLEAAGELKASQALQDVCLSETNVWRPEIGLAESALRRKDGTGHAASHYGDASLVVSPALYGQLVRQYGMTGMLELDQVKALVQGGVFYSNMIQGNKGVLLSNRAPNVQMVVGQDLVTGYTESSKMNHIFRVMETAALLIRRADAIVTIE